jgi:hypothetical protein
MKGMFTVLGFVALTFVCWGAYGPVLHWGQAAMGHSRLRPFICVGVAYFLIAVVVPLTWLKMRGEQGHWTLAGTVWSVAAGTIGAIGALGIIMAFGYRGSPVYVMPIVFGGAPVINTFVTMAMARTFKQANYIFYAGLVLVVLGAVTVLLNKPVTTNITVSEDASGRIEVVRKQIKDGAEVTTTWTADNLEHLETDTELKTAHQLYRKQPPLEAYETVMIGLSIALVILCWGAYGPVLHRGQMKMSGSRLRPLLCVGLAYFAIAVVVPSILITGLETEASFTFTGTMWSLLAGLAGVLGALGIIMAFNFGGKPLFVMPLVFGGAPVVNSAISIIESRAYGEIPPMFFTGLAIVIIGAVTVLVFAPKGGHGPPAKVDG